MSGGEVSNGNYVNWKEWDRHLIEPGKLEDRPRFGYCGTYEGGSVKTKTHSVIKWAFNPYWEDKVCTTIARFFCFGDYSFESKKSICLN